MKIVKCLSVFACSFLLLNLVACGNKEDKIKDQQKETIHAPKSINPFPFYKSIEIKPGYHFEVVSWGKGIDTVGSYLLLMSDSVKNNYKSLSADRTGIITDAWNMDLDNDGNPEIYVQYLVRKNVNDLNVYEFSGNGFNKISFPGLKESLKKDYQGNDKFYVKNGDLYRSVPLILSDSGQNTVLIKTLKYALRGNSFSSVEEEAD